MMVRLLDRTARGNAHVRAMKTDGGDAFFDKFKSSRHTADAVVYAGGAVDRNDDIVEARRNFFRALLK